MHAHRRGNLTPPLTSPQPITNLELHRPRHPPTRTPKTTTHHHNTSRIWNCCNHRLTATTLLHAGRWARRVAVRSVELGELSWAATGTGAAGEGLGDREPLRGDRAM